jgi:hypothetical protein
MVTVLVIHNDAALRLTVRRVLDSAGFAVSEAPDAIGILPADPQLIVADAAALAAVRQGYPTAHLLVLGEKGGLQAPFTPSQLLTAVRLTLVRGATREPRRRSASQRRRQA